MDPAVGQLVTIDEACQIDHAKFTLSWRPDNLAKVGLRHQDSTGMVQCCKASTCGAAEMCASGRPHKATWQDGLEGATTCYDHQPYVVGGVRVWTVAMSGPRVQAEGHVGAG